MKTVSTFNALHLGDNLVHVHFLRALAKRYPEIHFIHGAPDHHLAQLYPVWQDLENLTVKSIAEVGQGAINAWCGADGWWYHQPTTQNWCATYLRWLDHLSRLMGLDNPIRTVEDLLFDYPALKAPPYDGGLSNILVVNSPPMSGQWGGFSNEGFDALIRQLYNAGHFIVTTSPSLIEGIACTRDQSMDVTAIGRLSQRCLVIIGCVTGPMWPCLNVWNADTVNLRIHLQDREHVTMCANTTHANHLSLVPELLRDCGLL